MPGPSQNDSGDKPLGLDQPIDRRDFLNSTLLAPGGLLLGHPTPADLMAQGSTHFQIPYPHSYLERFYESIGMDYRQFKYQSWGGSEREIPLSRSPYQMLSIEPATYGFYFGAKFRQQPGLWLVDPWGRKLEGAPLPSEMRRELVKWHEAESKNTWPPKLPFAYPGAEVSRRYDSQTLEQVMMQEDGLSQETVRTFFAQETAGGFGLGPDALSGYCKFVWDAFYAPDDTPATGWP